MSKKKQEELEFYMSSYEDMTVSEIKDSVIRLLVEIKGLKDDMKIYQSSKKDAINSLEWKIQAAIECIKEKEGE